MRRLSNIPVLFIFVLVFLSGIAGMRATGIDSFARIVCVSVSLLYVGAATIYYLLGKLGLSLMKVVFFILAPVSFFYLLLTRAGLEHLGMWCVSAISWFGLLLWAEEVDERLSAGPVSENGHKDD